MRQRMTWIRQENPSAAREQSRTANRQSRGSLPMLPDRARRVTDILAACPRTVTAAFAVTRLTAVKYPAIADESA